MEYIMASINLILGGIIGYLISNYFHKKNSLFVTDMHNLSYSLEVNILQAKYPNIFTSNDIFIKDFVPERPTDPDIPHIVEVRTETIKIERGNVAKFLIRFADAGRNLPYFGTEIRNDLNSYKIPLFSEGFAWFSYDLEIPNDAPLGRHKVDVLMKDLAGKQNKQFIEYVIIE